MRWSVLASVCSCLICLVGACATPQQGEPRAVKPEAAPVAAQRLTVLGGSMSPLRDEFDAHSDKWRVVMVVSPTCNECVLGARTVEREILARYSAERVHASVVWIPMLAGDDEAAARHSTGLIARANASHFYDSVQAVGWAYDRGPFADMDRRVQAALSASHTGGEDVAPRSDDRPQWDLYMLYAPGVRWEEAGSSPPVPTAWLRHVGRRGGPGEPSSYWRDTLDSPPLEGDLYRAMRAMAEETMGPP